MSNSPRPALKRSNDHMRKYPPSPPSKRRCLSVSQLVEDSPINEIITSSTPIITKSISTSSVGSSFHSISHSSSSTDSNAHHKPKQSHLQHNSNSHASPTNATQLQPSTAADKFTKSRAVGQSHRDNEREYLHALSTAVAEGRAENLLLYTLYLEQQEHEECGNMNDEDDMYHSDYDSDDAFCIRSHLSKDLPEDYGITTDEMAEEYGLVKLPSVTAARLGQRYISPVLASALMEVILCRRNLVTQQPEPTSQTSPSMIRPRRRRSSYRHATNTQQANSIVNYAMHQLSKSFHSRQHVLPKRRRRCTSISSDDETVDTSYEGDSDSSCTINKKWTFVDSKLGALGRLFSKYDDIERQISTESLQDDVENTPPGSPTRPDAAEFGSPNRRRGEGAKRCSRCHKLKVSGSGHGRSKCDDGLSISSTIPYPAPPKPDEPHLSC